MPEPVIEPAVEPVTTPVVAPVTAEPVYFGTDGALNDGWMDTLPEGYREEASLATVKDAKVLAKMFVDTKRMVGKDTIAIPSDTSTELEWEAYHKAGGRPETVEDYGLKAPDGMDEEMANTILPKERLTAWQERFFKAGISHKAANQFITDFAQDMIADIQSNKQAEEMAKAELVKGLSVEYGAAFDQKMHFGDIAVEEGTGGDVEFKERLAPLRKNPDFIKLVVNLGEKFSEGNSPNFANVPTPGDLQEQISKIEADPLYLNGTQKQRMDLANKVMALREKMPVK